MKSASRKHSLPSPLEFSRRGWMKTVLSATAADAFLSQVSSAAGTEDVFFSKSEFPITGASVYLNNGAAHPLGRGAINAIHTYFQEKAAGTSASPVKTSDAVKAHFAALINAPVPTVSLTTRTIAGENLVVTSLDLAHTRGNIVTDELHFQGSLNLYHALQAKGADIRIVKARNWGIELADLEKAVDRETKLIAISAVSQVNGFQHDLKAVSDLAHSHGAYVYVDAVQAVGAVPIDVRASGIDFLGCGAQKWLMGDYGLGFLYLREGLPGDLAKKAQFGVRQITGAQNHLFPNDTTLSEQTVPAPQQGTALYLDVGVVSQPIVAALNYTLPIIRRIGVEAIQARNSAMVARLRKEIPLLGYECATPENSHSALVGFAYAAADRQTIAAKLKKANVDVKVDQRVIRVSPSVYNDSSDIDKLLEALS